MNADHEYEIDGPCNRNNCKGIIKLKEVQNCTCHIDPPCTACLNQGVYCTDCGWTDEEE